MGKAEEEESFFYEKAQSFGFEEEIKQNTVSPQKQESKQDSYHKHLYPELAIQEEQSGICGDFTRWFLNTEGVLSIEGSGNMYDFEHYDAPWHIYYPCIKEVVFSDGITHIGNFAMESLHIQSVRLPETLQSIGKSAFAYCGKLEQIQFPETLLYIDSHAFDRCKKLQDVVFPSSLQSIGDCAFVACEGFRNIVIPETLTDIGIGAFESCVYLNSAEIRSPLREIPDSLFCNCRCMKGVILPPTIEYIGQTAFAFDTYLYEVKIPENCEVDETAFSKTFLSSRGEHRDPQEIYDEYYKQMEEKIVSKKKTAKKSTDYDYDNSF